MDFTLQVQRVQDTIVIELSGEFDIYSAPRFKEMVAAHLQRGDHSFVIVLDSLRYLDSSGIAAVITAYRKVQNASGSLRLVVSDPRIKHVLAIAGISRLLEVFPTRREALEAAATIPAGA